MSRKLPKMPPAAIAQPAKTVGEAIADVTAAAAPTIPAVDPASIPPILAANSATAATVVGSAADVVETVETQTIKTAEPVITAAEEVASTVQKDVKAMATQFENTETLNTVNDGAKSAVEKGQKFVAEFGDFGKGNVEAMVEAGKIAARGFETLGQDNAEFTRRSFEGLTANAKSLASVKSPTEFFKLQSDYMRSAFDGVVAQTSKNTEAMIKLASDAAQPLSNRFAVAVEKVKTAA